MESRKQSIQHRTEMKGIPRKTVTGNRSTSGQQTWSRRTEGWGRGAPRKGNTTTKSNDRFPDKFDLVKIREDLAMGTEKGKQKKK